MGPGKFAAVSLWVDSAFPARPSWPSPQQCFIHENNFPLSGQMWKVSKPIFSPITHFPLWSLEPGQEVGYRGNKHTSLGWTQGCPAECPLSSLPLWHGPHHSQDSLAEHQGPRTDPDPAQARASGGWATKPSWCVCVCVYTSVHMCVLGI